MKQISSINYFLTRSLFLGFGISLILNYGKDSYLGALLGIFIGLIINYFYKYIINNKPSTNLDTLYQKNKKLGLIAKTSLFIVSYLILLYTLILYITFVISFLLVSSPEYYCLIPFIILSLMLAFKGLTNISRVSFVLLFFSLIFTLLGFLGLLGLFNTQSFLPILTNTPLNFLKATLTFAGISTFPSILTLHFPPNPKHYQKSYLLSSLTILFTIIFIIGVYGEPLMNIFRFPEYTILKQIKMFNFIEKVENIFSVVWIFDLFITTTMAIYSINKALPPKNNKLITIIILIVTSIIIDTIFSYNYVNELRLYYLLPILSLTFSIVILIIYLILIKKTHTKSSSTI